MIKMNLIKLKKQKTRQTEKIYIIELMNIDIILRIFEQYALLVETFITVQLL